MDSEVEPEEVASAEVETEEAQEAVALAEAETEVASEAPQEELQEVDSDLTLTDLN